MKTTFLATLIATLAQAKLNWSQLNDYTFQQFVHDYNLDIKHGTEDYAMRHAIFTQELERVIEHNHSGASWKENINHMSHMTTTEKKAYRGRTKGKVPRLESQMDLPADFMLKSISELPYSVDWRSKGVVSAVKDQGSCGSCWAFASTATIESYAAINTGLLFDLSPQQIAACAPNPDECGGTGNCFGATAEIAFDYVAQSEGIFEEFQYPYTSYYGVESTCAVPVSQTSKVQISGFVKLTENSYLEVLNALSQVGPLAVAVDASNWHAYDSGIFNGCNQTQPDINHVVVLIGYGTDSGQGYWLVRNSWSASWGEAGYIRLYRDDNEGQNCGVDITPLDGQSCASDPSPVTTCGTCGVIYDTAYPTNAVATSAANNYFLF